MNDTNHKLTDNVLTNGSDDGLTDGTNDGLTDGEFTDEIDDGLMDALSQNTPNYIAHFDFLLEFD